MRHSYLNKPIRRLAGVVLAAALSSGFALHGASAVHDFQALSLGPIHGQGAWTFAGGAIPQEEVRVAPGGLYWVGADNGIIPGGTQYLRTRAGLDDHGKMNNFASLGSVSIEGTTYVRFLLRMDQRPTGVFGTDPYEFFFGFAQGTGGPWNAYAALKHPVAGGDPIGVETTNSGAVLPNAKVVLNETLLVVARFNADGEGDLTGIDVWLNPTAVDAGSPDHSVTFADAGVNLSEQTHFNVRAQNMPVAMDNVVFADSWGAVVPPAYDGTLRPPVVLLPPASPEGEIGDVVEVRAVLWDHPDNTVTGYQWQANNTQNIPGSLGGTSNPLPFIVGTSVQPTNPVTLGINSVLRVRVTNAHGTTITPNVTIRESEIPEPPIVTTHPRDRDIMDGDVLDLSVGVFSLIDVTYQWFRNGEPIDGATDARLRIFDASEADAGTYFVEATNELGTTRSDDAIIHYDDGSFPEDARVVRLSRVAALGPNIAAEGQVDDQVGPGLSPHDPADEPPTVASMPVEAFSNRIGQAFNENRGGVFDFNLANAEKVSGRELTQEEIDEDRMGAIKHFLLDLGGTEIGVTPIIRWKDQGYRGREHASPDFIIPTGFMPRTPLPVIPDDPEEPVPTVEPPMTSLNNPGTGGDDGALGSSPPHTLTALSYIKLDFDPADKVDLVGFVFVNRNYFQSHRSTKPFPDKPNIRATARFSNGAETVELISTGTTAQGEDVEGGGIGYNTFFGFESPGEGYYLENIDVWALGNTWRLIFSIDDLAVAVAEIPVSDVPVTGVAVSPASFELGVGATRQLSVEIAPANATNQALTWSSNNTAVATVSDAGLVTAVAEGTATITVITEDGDFTATSQVTVSEEIVVVPVTGVSVSPTSVTLTVGDTEQLSADVSPANATNTAVTWSSDNTAVATVSGAGVVSAVGAGSATITVTTEDGDFTATTAVAVEAAVVPVTGVSVSPVTLELTVGGTQQLSAEVAPANATNQSVTWSSDDTSVAAVSGTGVVTAVGVGTATITVTTEEGSFVATAAVTVEAAVVSVTGVSVSPTSVSLIVGDTEQLSADISPTNATNQTVTWSSDNAAVATVSGAGVVTAVGAGSATITVTTEDGGFTATTAVTVDAAEIPVSDVVLSPSSFELLVGESRQLSAEVSPSDATNKTVTWSSDDTDVATVDGNGLVTGVGAGSARITVTTEDGDFTASSSVTVLATILFFPDVIGATATENADEYASEWFGVFLASEADAGWIWHEGLGWLYAGLAASDDVLWLWSIELDGWLYTDASIFPFIWRNNEEGWIYYLLDVEGIGYQFDYLTNEWSVIGE